VCLAVAALGISGCGAGAALPGAAGPSTAGPSTATVIVDTPGDLAPFVDGDWTASGTAVGQMYGACVPATVPQCYRQANQAATDIGTLIAVLRQVHLGPTLKPRVADLVRDVTVVSDILTGYEQYLLGNPMPGYRSRPSSSRSCSTRVSDSRSRRASLSAS